MNNTDIEKISSYSPYEPFCDNIIYILDILSKKLFQSSTYQNELAPLAFEIRRTNTERLKNKHQNCLPRGIVLFICPKNVDVISCYSVVYGLLTGNFTVIRPKIGSSIFSYFMKMLIDVFHDANAESYLSNLVVLDSKDEDVLKVWSKVANVRVGWGGNETVSRWNSYEKMCDCKDVFFAHRSSLAIIDCDNATNMRYISEIFYKSSFLFGQESCSSPRAVYFLHANNEQIDDFWRNLFVIVKDKQTNENILSAEDVMFKYSNLCRYLSENPLKTFCYDNLLYVMKGDIFEWTNIQVRGCGLFFSFKANSIKECFDGLKQIQTIAYFGVDKHDIIQELLNCKNDSVTRILPLQDTLSFDSIVDGVDILSEITRLIKY